jgi:hypothetical protein
VTTLFYSENPPPLVRFLSSLIFFTSTADEFLLFANPWVVTIVPSTGGHGHKRPAATRWNKSILQDDQVMTHVELPPYRGPHGPLDLIAFKIICGRIFEAFQHMS